jgi:hypothetical protein
MGETNYNNFFKNDGILTELDIELTKIPSKDYWPKSLTELKSGFCTNLTVKELVHSLSEIRKEHTKQLEACFS